MAAFAVDPAAFGSRWHFSASLVPRQNGMGGKVKLGAISKRGNGYLRLVLVNGAMSVLCSKQAKEDSLAGQIARTNERKVAACALANKMGAHRSGGDDAAGGLRQPATRSTAPALPYHLPAERAISMHLRRRDLC